MKVYFNKGIGPYRKGATKNVPEKLARFYIKNGIAQQVDRDQTYETKVMVAAPPAVKPKAPPVAQTEPDEFEGLGVEELRVIAQLRGVKVHHNAGAQKIKEALKRAETV